MSSRAYRIGVFLSVIGVVNIAIAVAIHHFAVKERERAESALASSATGSAIPGPSGVASVVLEPIAADSGAEDGGTPEAIAAAMPSNSGAAPAAGAAKSASAAKPLDWRQAIHACDQCNAKACLDLADYDARGDSNRAPMPGVAQHEAKKACGLCGGAANPATAKRCAAWGFGETQN